MKLSLTLLTAALLAQCVALHAAELKLTSPLDYQVDQRSSREKGTVRIAGALTDGGVNDQVIEARLVDGKGDVPLERLPAIFKADEFEASMEVPAGGWRRLEVRVSAGGREIARGAVEHLGVGEVFIVAGQSNSANHGEVKQATKTGRVAAFDGVHWQIADDPQPGASGQGGSFMPALGDEMVRRFDVPVGFVACGIGATSVREWLPKGATFPNPPTIERRVEKLPSGDWASKGDAFSMLVTRMKHFGPRGFRAVLWHQGESDANQQDPARTLPGKLYREYLEKIIRDSRREIGWEAPWFVAQASYHEPGDEASPDIRAAQASLWEDGAALEGPDSDALRGEFREHDGQGVHFSGQGLQVHGLKWAERVCSWMESSLAGPARP